MDHLNRSLNDGSSERKVEYEGQDKDVSKGNNISKWLRYHVCDILAKIIDFFCICPKNLPKIKLKSFRINSFAKNVSRLPRMDCFT